MAPIADAIPLLLPASVYPVMLKLAFDRGGVKHSSPDGLLIKSYPLPSTSRGDCVWRWGAIMVNIACQPTGLIEARRQTSEHVSGEVFTLGYLKWEDLL